MLPLFLFLLGITVAQIKILSPPRLVTALGDGGRIKASTSTFGAPSYGESFIGNLYTIPSLSNYCESDYTEAIKNAVQASPVNSMRTIVLVSRGNCSFVKKALIAQNEAMADAMIVINDEDVSPDVVEKIIMADDGEGGKVRIPSLLVSKQDGLLLKESLNAGQKDPVLAELEWNIPKNSKVTIDFWSDSGNHMGQNFLKDFKAIVDNFHTTMEFNIHFNIFGMEDASEASGSTLCHELTSDFCAEPPTEVYNPPITGRDVLMEDLRQLCLRRAEDKGGDTLHTTWWSYVEDFINLCPLDGDVGARFGQKCSEMVLKTHADQYLSDIHDCMRFHYNEILKTEKQTKAWSLLALRINGARYSGQLDPVLVARAACVASEQPPPACKEYLKPGATIQPTSGASLFTGFLIFVGGLCALGLGICVYQAHVKRSLRDSLRHEVMLEVRAQMQEYRSMDDNSIPPSRKSLNISGGDRRR